MIFLLEHFAKSQTSISEHIQKIKRTVCFMPTLFGLLFTLRYNDSLRFISRTTARNHHVFYTAFAS